MITVKELIKHIFGISQIRVLDQPLETLFYGNVQNLKEVTKYEYILTRSVDTFTISDASLLTITLEEPTQEQINEKIRYQQGYRPKNNYGQRRIEG